MDKHVSQPRPSDISRQATSAFILDSEPRTKLRWKSFGHPVFTKRWMRFTPINSWKSWSPRNDDSRSVARVVRAADSLAGGPATYAGRNRGRQTTASGRCHHGVSKSYRARSDVRGRLHQSRPDLHGEARLRFRDRSPEACSANESRFRSCSPATRLCAAGTGVRGRGNSTLRKSKRKICVGDCADSDWSTRGGGGESPGRAGRTSRRC